MWGRGGRGDKGRAKGGGVEYRGAWGRERRAHGGGRGAKGGGRGGGIFRKEERGREEGAEVGRVGREHGRLLGAGKEELPADGSEGGIRGKGGGSGEDGRGGQEEVQVVGEVRVVVGCNCAQNLEVEPREVPVEKGRGARGSRWLHKAFY
jgi:hypothetical protein